MTVVAGRAPPPPAPAPAPAAALAALRAATSAVHLRLHALPAFARIADRTIGLAEYRALLGRLHGYHAPLEALFAARAADFATYGLDIAARFRVPALADDLRALGDEPEAPPASATADRPSTAALFGLLYVREGSTLGGRILARHLDPLFGTRLRGRRFFAGDARVATQWKETCAALEAVVVAEPAAVDDLVAGARDGFERFERWLT